MLCVASIVDAIKEIVSPETGKNKAASCGTYRLNVSRMTLNFVADYSFEWL